MTDSDKRKVVNRTYYYKNAEKLRQNRRERYRKNIKENLEYNRKYYLKNREKILGKNKGVEDASVSN